MDQWVYLRWDGMARVKSGEVRSSEVRVTSPAHDTTSNHFKPELTVYDFQSIDYSLERFEKRIAFSQSQHRGLLPSGRLYSNTHHANF